MRPAVSPTTSDSPEPDEASLELSAATLEPVPPELLIAELPQDGRPGVDLLRLFAVCAIAWFHAGGDLRGFLAFRLPAVALITSMVQARSRRWGPRGVLVPWAFWAFVYTLVLAYRVHHHGLEAIPEWVRLPDVLLAGGPVEHLWYAPVAVLAGGAAYTFRKSARWKLLLGTAAAFVVTYFTRDVPFPYSHWTLVLPTIPAGILLARDLELLDVALLSTIGAVGGGTRFLIAIPLVWVVAQWKGERFKSLATLSRGIYWSHVLCILLITMVMGVEEPVVSLLAAFLMSLALMLAPGTRRLL